MNVTIQPPSPESGTFVVTEQDLAAIDRVLSQIDRRNAQLDSFAYWKLALKLFKKFELEYTMMPDRLPFESSHRALLSSMMSATEFLHSAASRIHDGDLKMISLSKEALEANLKYLRSKYQQWYALVDPQTLGAVNKAIENGNRSASRENIRDAA